jgi:hypothetical protein
MKTAEQIRELTASILDKGSDADLTHITDESVKEMLAANAHEPVAPQGKDGITTVYYGHDMRYDGENYLFRADIPGSACGMRWWRLPRSGWDHEFQSQRCGNHNNLAVLKFTSR